MTEPATILPVVPKAPRALVAFAHELIAPLDAPMLLPDIVQALAAQTGQTGRLDRASGFYRNISAVMKALAEAGLVRRIDAETFGDSVRYAPPQDAPGSRVSSSDAEPDSQAPDDDDEQQEPVERKGQAVVMLTGPAARFDLAVMETAALALVASQAKDSVQADADAALDRMSENAARQIESMEERLTPEQAVRATMLFDAKESVFQEGAHLQRFLLGVVARRVSEAASYADRAMERLAEATGVHVNTVRQCRRLAERYQDSPVQFTRWMKAIRRELGRPARWYHIEGLIGTFSDPTVLGPEELARRVASGVEKAASRVDLLAGHEAEEGIKIVLTDAARTLREEGMARLAVVQDELPGDDQTPRDPMFLRFVSRLPCAATGAVPPDEGWQATWIANDAHHTGTGGTAIKGSDYTAVPLCREAHDFLHQHSYRAFRRKYDVDLLETMFQTLHLYIAEQQAQLPSALLASR